jgi:hypothetical protein
LDPFVGFPWDDAALLICAPREITAEARAGVRLEAVRDLGSDPISRGEHENVEDKSLVETCGLKA